MKYLGIDYGSKNIGLAVSDEGGKIAFPKIVIKNDGNTLANLQKLIKDEGVESIVIGESINQSGKDNVINESMKNFVQKLKDSSSLPVEFEREHFSSFEAHARQGKERFSDRKTKIEKTKDIDARAASIILQRYLDKNFREQ